MFSAYIVCAPMMATAIASTHMRIRDQSFMLTMSETAPSVQNCVRAEIAPRTKATTNESHATVVAKLVTAEVAEFMPLFYAGECYVGATDD
jgi:hypothetical protein